MVVFFQVATDWSPTGKHSTYPGVIIAFVGKIMFVIITSKILIPFVLVFNLNIIRLVLTEELRRNTEDNLENLKSYTRLATESDTAVETSDQYVLMIVIYRKDYCY